MGWLFTEGQTKADLIDRLTETDSKLRTHRQCMRGNTLWAVQENRDYPKLFIVAYLLRSDSGYGWGYKPVAESMGPADLSCPIGYLDAVPVADSRHAEDWRARVRQRNADKRRTKRALSGACVGDHIILAQGLAHRTLCLVSKRPLIGEASDGSRWRIPSRFIAAIQPA